MTGEWGMGMALAKVFRTAKMERKKGEKRGDDCVAKQGMALAKVFCFRSLLTTILS